MNAIYYLKEFQKAADQLDKKLLAEKRMEVATGLYFESVFLKLYKLVWTNKSKDPLTSESRIFFSVWLDDSDIKENKILYNIHALKLRSLYGYSIESRQFADAFRGKFKDFQDQWPNVHTNFGPQTLMQGWKKVNLVSFHDEILTLANRFLEIDYLVDNLLTNYKRPGVK